MTDETDTDIDVDEAGAEDFQPPQEVRAEFETALESEAKEYERALARSIENESA